MNLRHILTDPDPKSDYGHLYDWENVNKLEDIVALVSSKVSMVTNMKD